MVEKNKRKDDEHEGSVRYFWRDGRSLKQRARVLWHQKLLLWLSISFGWIVTVAAVA